MVGLDITLGVISSDYWLTHTDGTTNGIKLLQPTTEVFHVGGGSASVNAGSKLVFDERTGWLQCGNFTQSDSTEALRGTNCQALGRNTRALGNRCTVIGNENSTDANCSNLFVGGDACEAVDCQDSIILGLNCDCVALVEGAVIGRANSCTNAGNKTHCFMFGSSHSASETCTDIYMIGQNHTSSTLDATQNYMIGMNHTCSSTTAIPNILLGIDIDDGGFRGQLLCTASSSITGNSNFRCRMKYNGGFQLYTNTGATTGAEMLSGASSWSAVSDKNCKEEITLLDDQKVLEKTISIPVYSYKYKYCDYDKDGNFLDCEGNVLPNDPRATYMGPMAQDWNALFNNQQNVCSINQQDEIAVLLSCVRALHEKVNSLQEKIDLLIG